MTTPADVSVTWGQALAWRADVGVGGSEVHTLAILDDRLYIGGEFDSVAGQPRKNLAAVSVTTNELLPWDPRPDSTVFALAVNAGRVVVGGAFHGLGSEVHNRLGAIDLGTGTPLPFSARFRGLGRDRISVTTLEVQGDSVFAAGFCGPGNCRRSRYIARFDRQTGRMQRWNVPAGKPGDHDGFAGTYNALAASGRRLYVGGGFQAIGGRPRENLAAVDTRTGRVTRWRADTNGVIGDLLVHGHTLYLIGGFTRVDGHRRKGAAAIDLRSGRVTAWNPSVGLWDPDLGCCFLDAIVVAGQRVYLGGYFDRVGDHRRRYLVAVNRTDGRLERWNPRLNGGVNTLAVIGDTVYAGGRFTSVSGARRKYIAAIDAADGTPTAWNPDADGEVFHLLATPAGLLADGGFDRLGGVNVEHFGLFPRVETAAAHASARSRLDRTALAPD